MKNSQRDGEVVDLASEHTGQVCHSTLAGGCQHKLGANERLTFARLIRRGWNMTPTEFAVRMAAADERFEHALQCDDIPAMRAALAEKTELLNTYFAAPQDRGHNGKRGNDIRRPA